jgi:copper chaperone CopZ
MVRETKILAISKFICVWRQEILVSFIRKMVEDFYLINVESEKKADAIEKKISKLNGVNSVSISVNNEVLTCVYNEKLITKNDIIRIIGELGVRAQTNKNTFNPYKI